MSRRGHTPESTNSTSFSLHVDTFTSTQLAVDFAASLPREYQEALLRRACVRAGWPGQAPTWDDIKDALRPTPFKWQGGDEAALLSAQRLWSGTPTGWRDMGEYARFDADMREAQASYETFLRRRREAAAFAPLVAEISAMADQLRRILRRIDPRAHDLTNADDKTIRERAEQLAEGESRWVMCAVSGMRMVPDMPPAQNKRLDAAWWTRYLRRHATRAGLMIAQALGLVGQGQPYADVHTTGRWQERQDCNRVWGERTDMVSDDGDRVRLIDMMDSAAAAAMARVYGQLLGMQALGDQRGLVPVFFTVTLPGEWHPNPKHGHRAGTVWNECSAEEARQQLQKDWRSFRKNIKRPGWTAYGLRVIEPHQDGTPHLHAMEWIKPEDVLHVMKTLRRTFGSARRAKAVRILPRRKHAARPASYLLKYLVKSLNDSKAAEAAASGRTSGDDGCHLTHHTEHRAWASAINARRWDLTGGLSGIQKVWQAVYLWQLPPAHAPAAAIQAWHAMRAAQEAATDPDAPADASGAHWAAAIEALVDLDAGGERLVRLVYEEVETRYGDTRRKAVALTSGGAVTPLSTKTWTFDKHKENVNENNTVALVESYPRDNVSQDATAPAEDGEVPDNAPVETPQDDAEGDTTPGWAPADALAAQIAAVKRWRECHRQGIPCPHPASPGGRQDTSAEALGAVDQPGVGAVEARTAPLDPQAALASWAYHRAKGLPCPYPFSLEGRQALAEGRYPTPPQRE